MRNRRKIILSFQVAAFVVGGAFFLWTPIARGAAFCIGHICIEDLSVFPQEQKKGGRVCIKNYCVSGKNFLPPAVPVLESQFTVDGETTSTYLDSGTLLWKITLPGEPLTFRWRVKDAARVEIRTAQGVSNNDEDRGAIIFSDSYIRKSLRDAERDPSSTGILADVTSLGGVYRYTVPSEQQNYSVPLRLFAYDTKGRLMVQSQWVILSVDPMPYVEKDVISIKSDRTAYAPLFSSGNEYYGSMRFDARFTARAELYEARDFSKPVQSAGCPQPLNGTCTETFTQDTVFAWLLGPKKYIIRIYNRYGYYRDTTQLILPKAHHYVDAGRRLANAIEKQLCDWDWEGEFTCPGNAAFSCYDIKQSGCNTWVDKGVRKYFCAQPWVQVNSVTCYDNVNVN